MNDLQKDKLTVLAEDEILLEAIKQVFNEAIAKEKPNVSEIDNNVLLGEKYRAYEFSKKIINDVFITLNSYKKEKILKNSFNKGR